MNPTLSEKWVAKQVERDPARARAEYHAEFRIDIESYVSQEAVEACVETGRIERPYIPGMRYVAFVDAAGGSGSDSMTMAIAHREKKDVGVLDVMREQRPPFGPSATVESFIETLRAYKITSVTGDRYGGEFVREAFKQRGCCL